MRFRAGLFLCLFAFVLGLGCRKPLTPADNNQAPETWITSAPQDTITVRDKDGKVIVPQPGTVPVQYHLYWAGSDIDGTVAGFFYAVVETTAVPPPGVPLPDLPGPKPRDYHFTARTDTTFIFNVSDAAPDRQHAFFIYAVDNKGKPDPTPARFVFDALDRYPPAIAITQAQSVGNVFFQSAPGAAVTNVPFSYTITDTFNVRATILRDTVPANCVLHFGWNAAPTLSGTFVTGYQYKLDESQFVRGDSSMHTATYNSGLNDGVSPGPKQFTVRATDGAGGARTTTRRFMFNISPRTWFSGPDPNAFGYTHGANPHDIYYDLPNWSKLSVPDFAGSFINRDSVQILPALRPFRRTFFEIYKNRIYVRAENDTVDMNSWIVLSTGGFDPDSPYSVKVSPFDPALPDTSGIAPGSAVVLHPGPANGSPIGFKGVVSTWLTPDGPLSEPSFSSVYPNFDPSSVQRFTAINGYYGVFQAGKAYAQVQAVDGFVSALVGGQDQAIPNQVFENARQLADHVDAGIGTPLEIALRPRVMTFYVDKAPYLVPSDVNFKPVIPDATHPQTVYPSRTIDFYLVGTDDDPYDPDIGAKPSRIGGPSTNLVLRWTITFRGKDATGADYEWKPTFLNNVVGSGSGIFSQSNIVLNTNLVGPTVTMHVQLCDCRDCELAVGSGRCVTFDIPFTVPPPPTPAQQLKLGSPGPGSSNGVSGRDVR